MKLNYKEKDRLVQQKNFVFPTSAAKKFTLFKLTATLVTRSGTKIKLYMRKSTL